MHTIIHITYSTISDSNSYGLQIDSCKKKGMNVIILDISAIYNFPKPTFPKQNASLVKHLTSFSELDDFIKNLSIMNTLINVQIGYEWRFRKLFRLIARYPKHHFSLFLFGQLPFQNQRKLEKIIGKIISSPFGSLKKIVIKILEKILFKIHIYSLPKYIFYAGETTKPSTFHFEAYPINYCDYDYFLENQESSIGDYIVFLDDGIFQHPDDAIVGNKITPELITRYQKSMNLFFDYLEKKLNLEVIISGHPKVQYAPGFFGNRKIIRNESPKLIQKCKFAICHYSSSLSLAVCYKKPILFTYNQAIEEFSKENQPIKEYILNLSMALNQPIINIDDSDSINSVTSLEIDSLKYANFVLNYLTTRETQNTKSEDVFSGYLKRIFKSKD
ncbi:hypothetical protein SHI21_10450 [Bacteriovorax sp. PP10]|uniref:Uncharacterized protein n=1 Tax=Bacteriovorax antarcticus TaxID=3088717 RepID=A0ABU5VUA3_9BACT|nr:hypothetical protein [Bacteriovorax sp. PP10]MEA9356628.1 hypothetical protein [Bacteriovorax sp. PP10]